MISRLNAIPRFALPYTARDFMAALFALMRGAPSPAGFKVLGASPKFWTRSGRQALRLLLTALDLQPGSGVALPLFTDPSLVGAIVAAGHRPVFIDINPQTLTIDPKSLDAASGTFSAVVIVHLFGHLADVPSLLSVARNIPVIEDTAHAPLSFLNGRMAGTFGPASFYSFASTKYWPAGGGGLAVVSDPVLAGKLAGLISSLRRPSHAEAMCNLALQCAKSLVFRRAVYGIVGMPLRRRVESWALLEPRLDTTGIAPSHAAAALLQASRFIERVERQRSNSMRLLSWLAGAENVVLPREPGGAQYNYHLFPVLLRDRRERAAVAQTMWKEFIDTSMIYSRAIDECRKWGYRDGCPVAESVAERLLTLPNYASLNSQEIDKVAEVFLSSLRASRNACPTARNPR
ncbi:MAG TPA: DegT/DnrJ/EryC1/StrS family aminotransferase [Bryobacteraceae bacterium]